MRRTRSVTVPSGAGTVKRPDSLVYPPSAVPRTLMLAVPNGSPLSDVTTPDIRRPCAHALVPHNASSMDVMTNVRILFTPLSCERIRVQSAPPEKCGDAPMPPPRGDPLDGRWLRVL